MAERRELTIWQATHALDDDPTKCSYVMSVVNSYYDTVSLFYDNDKVSIVWNSRIVDFNNEKAKHYHVVLYIEP
jgi:hypothetical protein